MTLGDTPILDDANRSNEGPPMTGWGDIDGGLKVVSQEFAGDVSGPNTSYWLETFGNDQEVYVTFKTLPGANEEINLFVRLNFDNVSSYYFIVYYTGTSWWYAIHRFNDGGETELAREDQSIPAAQVGDTFGFRVVGDDFVGWKKPSGGSAAAVISVTDTGSLVGTNIGMDHHGTTIRTDDFGGGTVGPATTGRTLPQSANTSSESPWSDDNWNTPTNVEADDGSTANITAPTFDSGDQSYILRAYNFDLSAIPDGSTINGVIVRVNAWYRSGQGSGSIDMLSLLNTSLARVGNNKCSTALPLGTDNTVVYGFGGANDTWGNALTDAWVKNSNFGVGLGMLSTAQNTDVDVDYIDIEVYYTEPAGGNTYEDALTLARDAGVGQGASLVVGAGLTFSRSLTIADGNVADLGEAMSFAKMLDEILNGVFDADVALPLARSASMSIAGGLDIETALSFALTHSLSQDSLISKEVAMSLARMLGVSLDNVAVLLDTLGFARTMSMSEAASLLIEQDLTLGRSAGVSASSGLELTAALLFAQAMSLSPGGVLAMQESIVLARSLAAALADTAIMDEAMTFARTLLVSEVAEATLADAITFARALGIVLSSGAATYEKSLALGKVLGVALSNVADLQTALAILKVLDATVNGGLVVADAVLLARSAAVVLASVVTKEDVVAFAKALGVTDTAQLDAAVNVTLAAVLGITPTDLADLVSSVTLGRTIGLASGNTLDIQTALSLARILATATGGSVAGAVTAIIALTLNKRSIALTLRDRREDLSLNDRSTDLTPEDR